MGNIFKKYTIIIMTTAIFSILVINFLLSINSLENQQLDTFNTKIDQVIHTIKNNQEELDTIKENLDEDYLTRAKAAAYVIEKNPEVLDSVEELRNLAALLDVDELHVTESDAIIRYSSVPEYIGLDFHNGKQMRGFLPIFESKNTDEYIIQEAQPNTAEGKMMKYVGISRKGGKGLVQVGLEPVRQLEAQERNTYDYIFSRFPTEHGESFFAINMDDTSIIGSTLDDTEIAALAGSDIDELKEYTDGAYSSTLTGLESYVVTKEYDDVMIAAVISRDVLYRNFWSGILQIFCYLLFIEIIAVILLNYLVKQKVVNGIHRILDGLSNITKGKLDTKVEVGGNPEFEQLSQGINQMVNSVVGISDRISRIIKMAEIPLAAFEYQDDTDYVFVTATLKELLDIPEDELNDLTMKPQVFLDRIHAIMGKPIDDSADVFQITPDKYIRIHLTVEPSCYYGAVSDVTDEILEMQRMIYENNHDQLTGLCRYAYFKDQANRLLSSMSQEELCAAVMLDLDFFKKINDTYGHDTGDKFLKNFAGCMKKLPSQYCLTSRRSGDEFCIFIHGCRSKKEISTILKQFWNDVNMNKLILPKGEECQMSVSGGYVCSDHMQTELKKMLHKADQALYRAKQSNRGNFVEYDCHTDTQ